jgi:hypothetical protein
MATGGVLARVGLVSAVAVILGISTLSPLLKPASDFGRPAVSGPPLYQSASVPLLAATEPGAAVEGRVKPASPATARLALPARALADRAPLPPAAARPLPQTGTTAVAPPQQQTAAAGDEPPPAPIVAESEPPPKVETRAAAPKRPRKPRARQPPIYSRAVQMSIY